MYSAAEPVLFNASGSWGQTEQRLGGPIRARLLFAVAYVALLAFDHTQRTSMGGLPLLQSSVGLLWIVLWLSRLRLWPLFLAIHFVGATAMAMLLAGADSSSLLLQAIVPGGVTAMAAAAACLALIRGPLRLHMGLVPRVMSGLALGALAGAVVAGAIEWWSMAQDGNVLGRLPLLWAGLLLGGLTTGPAVLMWSQARPSAHPELLLRSRRQLLLSSLYLLTAVAVAFWWALSPGGHSLLPLPLLVLPAMVHASFSFPPRWPMTQVVVVNLLCAGLWLLRSESPAVVSDPEVRIGLMQVLLGLIATVPFILAIVITQVRITLWNLGESEHRYRSFMQLSRDAVWRVEVDPPMPIALPLEQQREWLRAHARVVEGNEPYAGIAQRPADSAGDANWSQGAWGTELLRRLGELAAAPHCIEDLRFSTKRDGRARTFLASFSAMLEEGGVRRLWGVARDVTELANLNVLLASEQERLRGYARQIAAAEENARRATAVDLHDGIGQTLVGMLMMIEAAREQSTPQVRRLLDEMRLRLRDVQETTRRMISDLSPPGLYDLGLVPALQWLTVYLRKHNNLEVQLDCDVREEMISIETRVLVFKLVRELLRNVVKHAGVLSAQVLVEEAGESLRVIVSDQGRGFEWQLDMFGSRTNGFGLWSISDRLQEVGGTIQIKSAEGTGARFEMQIPRRLPPKEAAQRIA
jgi:signal transduction histidine kinase